MDKKGKPRVQARERVTAAWDALRARPLAILLLASAALKLYYVFQLTAYPSYLFSDFGGYLDATELLPNFLS